MGWLEAGTKSLFEKKSFFLAAVALNPRRGVTIWRCTRVASLAASYRATETPNCLRKSALFLVRPYCRMTIGCFFVCLMTGTRRSGRVILEYSVSSWLKIEVPDKRFTLEILQAKTRILEGSFVSPSIGYPPPPLFNRQCAKKSASMIGREISTITNEMENCILVWKP